MALFDYQFARKWLPRDREGVRARKREENGTREKARELEKVSGKEGEKKSE